MVKLQPKSTDVWWIVSSLKVMAEFWWHFKMIVVEYLVVLYVWIMTTCQVNLFCQVISSVFVYLTSYPKKHLFTSFVLCVRYASHVLPSILFVGILLSPTWFRQFNYWRWGKWPQLGTSELFNVVADEKRLLPEQKESHDPCAKICRLRIRHMVLNGDERHKT